MIADCAPERRALRAFFLDKMGTRPEEKSLPGAGD